MISGKLYDWLKWLAQIVLPAIGSLYFGLAGVWGLPAADKAVGTIVLVDTFLGILLGISTKAYNNSDEKYDGEMLLETDPGGVARYSLNLNGPAEHLVNKDEIIFRVDKQPIAG